MTEDQPDGGFYRFTPDRYPDLGRGTLEIARVADIDAVRAGTESAVEWLMVPDPAARPRPDRTTERSSARDRPGVRRPVAIA